MKYAQLTKIRGLVYSKGSYRKRLLERCNQQGIVMPVEYILSFFILKYPVCSAQDVGTLFGKMKE